MFKKFKDKLAEEMKQSPARLQASVQQLAQAVVSPALSNSSIQEVSASNDNFSLTEDGDETPKNTPVKHNFQNVDLMSPSANAQISRRSSVSSITSDVSSLFPMYESPPNLYHLQSDMDQSASEVDDNISPYPDRVTKDQLYSAYRKVQDKYHKYRGRYMDLATHYRELDRVKTKLESVLVETQDKVLRRITDLKEQCQLEQQAKAHLEEALRNDIEEKDHIINTLNTKVKLLQAGGESTLENSVSEKQTVEQRENSNLIDLNTNEPSNGGASALIAENVQLKDRMKKLENLVLRYKESLKLKKEKFVELMEEKRTAENNYDELSNTTRLAMSEVGDELNTALAKVARLTKQVKVLQKREEESAISLAENKLSVHRELEEKEEQIKQLRIDLKHMAEEKESLSEAVAQYKAELSAKSRSLPDSVADKDRAVAHDASKEKSESCAKSAQQAAATRQSEEVDHGEDASAKSPRDEDASRETTLRLREKEVELEDMRRKLDDLEKQIAEHKHDKDALQAELTSCKVKYSELRSEHDAQRIVTEERRKDADATIEKLQATVQSVDKELENMRGALIDRDQVCENYNKKVQQYTAMLEKAKQRLGEQEMQTKSLKSRLDELVATQQELEDKRAELNAVRSELELCRSTIDDLGNKVQVDSSAINLLKKERSDLINRLVHYKDCMRRLKQDCADLTAAMREEFSNRRAEMSALNVTLTATFTATLSRLEEENATLSSRTEELRSQDSERPASSEEARLRSELDKIATLKATLGTMLKANKEESMAQSDQLSDELSALVNKLIAEMDNLQFKVYDLEKIACELTESRREAADLKERLGTLEDLELKCRTLSSENDDLKSDLAQASRTADEVDELSAKLREANHLIDSLKSQNSDQDRLREEELRASRAEVARSQSELVAKDREIKSRDEKIAQQEQQVAHLISACDSHIQTIEEHVRKYLNLEEEYQTARESHANQTTELMESNKKLQKVLKKLKSLKEQQGKSIEEMNAELYELRTKHAELSDSLAAADKQIESLKSENSQLATITLENKDLKDKHNNLLSHNRKLCENEEAMKQKIDSYEKDIQELRREAEAYKSQSNSCSEEMERLGGQLTALSAQLEFKNAESSSLSERLFASEEELRESKEKLEERSAELLSKVSQLDAAAMSADAMREENERLCVQLQSLQLEVGRVKELEDENTRVRSQLDDLTTQKGAEVEVIRAENDKLAAERVVLQDRLVEVEGSYAELQSRMSEFLEASNAENKQLRAEVDALRSASGDSSAELIAVKDSLARKEAEVKSLEEKSVNTSQEIKALELRSAEKIDEKSREADTLREKVAELQSEVASLDVLREDLENARRGNEDSDKLREENKRLEAQLDEALITFQAKETQMQLVNNELREQLGQLKEQARTSEEEQGMRLKQLVKEFQAQLHDKEEELQAALEKRFDRQHNYESDLVQQYKEQLKDFQVELTEKSEQIESLVLEKKDVVAEKGKDIDRLVETITQIKKEHANEIREVEKKWKAIVQQRIDNLQAKHEEELNELTKEWQNERKPDVQTEAAAEELESTSRVAMAAIQTNTGSIHTMQQTLTSQRREIAELRKLVKLRHDTLEDSTEIEYLRNILFEYMMGRETMVLARVIAAVVKFDQEQTSKIMKKEEDKLTLFGSLGLT